MKAKACIFTDAGKTRKVNQDAALVKVANSKTLGRVSFIAVCDGMGGLSKGEVASCKAIRTLEAWFHEEFTLMQDLSKEELWDTIERSWRRLLATINNDLRRYAKHRRKSLGTTLVALLQVGKDYMLMNVGDSRIYITDRGSLVQLTKDQSVSEDSNVLLQGVGTCSSIVPEIKRGSFERTTTVIACSDGFWRKLRDTEIYKRLCPQMCISDEDMLKECQKLADLAVSRDETDNISVAALNLEY